MVEKRKVGRPIQKENNSLIEKNVKIKIKGGNIFAIGMVLNAENEYLLPISQINELIKLGLENHFEIKEN